jgi:hypothetical protein
MAENKKARILADAQKAASEVDRDIEELERLSAKYGLAVSDPTVGAEAAKELSIAETAVTGNASAAPRERTSIISRLMDLNEPKTNGHGTLTAPAEVLAEDIFRDALKDVASASMTKRARIAAEAYIRAKNRPIPFAELYDVLTEQGIVFNSNTPRNTLNAVLGQHSNLCSLSRDQGWWIKDTPVPIKRRI